MLDLIIRGGQVVTPWGVNCGVPGARSGLPRGGTHLAPAAIWIWTAAWSLHRLAHLPATLARVTLDARIIRLVRDKIGPFALAIVALD